MVAIFEPDGTQLSRCAQVYIAAYARPPWNERYEGDEVLAYLNAYRGSDVKRLFAFAEAGEIVGVALGMVVPCIGAPFFRLEDVCVDPQWQGRGCGSRFLDALSGRMRREGCDSVLLGTQRGFPAHRFYLKNGFREIESVLMYRETE